MSNSPFEINTHHETTIMLVDDHGVLLGSLKETLTSAGFKDIHCADSAEAARDAIQEIKPDLLITDISLPNENGLHLAKQTRRYLPGTKIIVLSMHGEEDVVTRAADIGVEGFVSKTASTGALLRAISSVLDGASVYPSSHKTRYRPSPQQETHLTQREQDILACLGQGQSNKEIARSLDMAEGTVKVHIKTILKKLNVRNRTQAAIYAYEQGYTLELRPF